MTVSLNADFSVRRSAGFELSVQLRIEPGSTAALLGPNGSGKSTAVEVLAGLLPADQGLVELGGEALDAPAQGVFVHPERRRVGVVFQRYLLFDHLDVLDNVAFGLVARGNGRDEARAVAERWLEAVGLSDLASSRPAELSGGQAQRTALARALAIDPDLLLLDEPLAALDVATRSELRRSLSDHLRTVTAPRLLITHDPTDAHLLADRVHVLEAGRITQSGTPSELRRRPATPYVAALAGLNLLRGKAREGQVAIDDAAAAAADGIVLQTSDRASAGRVLVTIHPNAIALHAFEPHGSPRNSWSTTVAAVEPLGEITRVSLGPPLELFADITPDAATALGIRAGTEVWVSIKATEISLGPP